MEKNNTYTIAERYELPSKGLVYNAKINTSVRLRSMTVRDEMRRCGASTDGTTHKKVAELLDSCIVDELGMSSYDLCINDFQYLLHKLNIVSNGSIVPFDYICPICKNHCHCEYDLNDMKETQLEEFNYQKEMFIELPYSKRKIELCLPTPRILDLIDKDIKRIEQRLAQAEEPMDKDDWKILYQLVYAIKSVDDISLSYSEKVTFCGKLVGQDYKAIFNRLNEIANKFGVSIYATPICEHCKTEIKIPFSSTSVFYQSAPTY